VSPLHTGFLTLIGLPNAGKSSLLNRLVGEDLAIISPKAQTTRVNLRGYVLRKELKLVVTDTPGLQDGTKALNQALSRAALQAMKTASQGGEVVALVVDGAHARYCLRNAKPMGLEQLASLVKEHCGVDMISAVCIPVINKADLFTQKDREALSTAVCDIAREVFSNLKPAVFISTQNEKGVEPFLTALKEVLPTSRNAQDVDLFEEDLITDQPLRDFAAEFVREQCFLKLGQELPYSVAVEIESFDESSPQMMKIQAAIHVERESQKAIVIGTKGMKIKEIGTAARERFERFTGKKAFLGLKVKVTPNWSKENEHVARFGYAFGYALNKTKGTRPNE
jgi:GTP-binding protein Era